MKILTICPSYGRPDELKKMMDSFYDTCMPINDLMVVLHPDDPQLPEYMKICAPTHYLLNPGTVTECINKTFKDFPDYTYYHLTNDDVIYHTASWDYKLSFFIEEYGTGIAYGNDLFHKHELPTFPFISAKLAKAVGYLQEPSLNRYFGDLVWKELGNSANCLYYLKDVIIEHLHILAGKSDNPIDDRIYTIDHISYIKWEMINKYLDAHRIKEALCV